jgi:EmrB/QacA subfamily drug resistance transporter
MRSADRGALLVLCLASFVAVADTTIVSVALPTIRDDLGFSVAGAQWILNAYSLSFGGLLLLAGRLGDRYGHRRMLVWGLWVFALGTALGAMAWSPLLLVLARLCQGAGSAAFIPAALALLTRTFPDTPDRGRALAAFSAMVGIGFVVGMVGGGILTELGGWRWIFLVNLPVAAVMIAGAARALPADRPAEAPGRLDAAGAAYGTLGLVALIYALTAAADSGWGSLRVLVSAAVGIALLVSFCRHEARHPDPLLPPRVILRRSLLLPDLAMAGQSMVGISWLYLLTMYFQDGLGHGPLLTGLLFLPMTLASVSASLVAGRLLNHWGPRRTAVTGLVVVGAGTTTMALTVPALAAVTWVVVGSVVAESGFMLSNVALTDAGTRAVDAHDSGLAAGLLNTSTQVGTAVGLAVVAATVGAATAAGADLTVAIELGLFACVAFCLGALAAVLAGIPRRAAPATPVACRRRGGTTTGHR